jgi:hypothetical protein
VQFGRPGGETGQVQFGRPGGEAGQPQFGRPSGETGQPLFGRPGAAGSQAPGQGTRPAEQRQADQGSDDADQSPETAAFAVQQPPSGDQTPAWGQSAPAAQDATMVAAPGWLGGGQPGSESSSPIGRRRAAREARQRGRSGEGRHGQPEPGRPDSTQVFPQPER